MHMQHVLQFCNGHVNLAARVRFLDVELHELQSCNSRSAENGNQGCECLHDFDTTSGPNDMRVGLDMHRHDSNFCITN